MKSRTACLLVAAVSGSTLCWLMGFSPQAAQSGSTRAVPSAPAAAATFTVDAVHSSNVFKVSHMGVSNFLGRFNTMDGHYVLDAQNPEASSFEIRIDAASVDTNNSKRDEHLRTPDFFNTAEHPDITFKSTKVAKAGENQLTVAGDLTFKGQTKPVTVDMRIFPAKETRQGFKSGFEGRFTIKRTDFGDSAYVGPDVLGDEVEVIVCVEGAKK